MSVDLGALAPLLSRDLDTIEDLPEFRTPPPGVYEFLIHKIEQKAISTAEKKDVPVIAVTYQITQILEQTEKDIPEAEQVKEGSLFGESFWFGDPSKLEDTLMYMKARFGGLAEACGTKDLFEIVQKAEGMLVRAVIGNRMDKTDKTKVYATIRDMVPAV